MQIGIFAKTFAGTDPLTVLAAVKAAGFGATQYNMACSGMAAMPDDIGADTASNVADASRQTGVSIAAVSGTWNMIHPNLVTRQDGHKRLAVLAARCAKMGTRLITLCTGTRDADDQWRWHPDNASAQAWADLAQSMEVAIEIADRHNVNLGIEPELANVVNCAAAARRLIDELKSPRLKIVLDPANLFERETLKDQRLIVSNAVDLLADRIVMGHAKDRAPDGSFATAGKGCLDFHHYLSCLTAIGFDGPLITHGLAAEEAPDVGRHLKALMASLGTRAK
jgi:sugar phosphate isomerase/epimerase